MTTVAIAQVYTQYWNALRQFPTVELERPRQYFERWHKHYKCRVIINELRFDSEEDLMWFMLKYS